MKKAKKPIWLIGGISTALLLIYTFSLSSCCGNNNVPCDTSHLEEFHNLTTEKEVIVPFDQGMALFVDYSNCISEGKFSPFYQKMVSPLTAATKEYWSIKGEQITKEDGDIFSLLNNVEEVNYAALDKAINQMAQRNGESILLTDGELFTQTATRDNPNNPYMYEAFKKWLMKGHDIHIIAEPYQEKYKGNIYNKKRFYIIFTDDRIEKNIYERIRELVALDNFPEVDEFHLSTNYPWLLTVNGQQSVPSEIFAAEIEPHGDWEIQDWQVDWKNIMNYISSAVDDNGELLPNGEKIIGGLKINKNAFGSYRISDIGVRTLNINDDYNRIYTDLETGEKLGSQEIHPYILNDFIILDEEEYKNHSNIDLYFDLNNFAPKGELDGKPFNYFVIEIYTKDVENMIGNHIDLFNFESIAHPGKTNESISASLQNAVFDKEIVDMLKDKVLYRIYVKSDKY